MYVHAQVTSLVSDPMLRDMALPLVARIVRHSLSEVRPGAAQALLGGDDTAAADSGASSAATGRTCAGMIMHRDEPDDHAQG